MSETTIPSDNRLFRTFAWPTIAISLVVCASACDSYDESADQDLTASEDSIEEFRAAQPLAALKSAIDPIPDQYIVVLRNDIAAVAAAKAGTSAQAMLQGLNAEVLHTYDRALKGFAVRMGAAELHALRANPLVEYISEDGKTGSTATQTGATWGLDRVDQRWQPLNNNYTYHGTGAGVHAYVVDSGILATHNDFGSRVGNGRDSVDNDSNPNDCFGHGTHVAGTIGGTTYGVAKGVTLHAVRVHDCEGGGSFSQLIDGIDWIITNHQSPAIVNMSLWANPDLTLDTAMANLINTGIPVVVAAANNSTNACSDPKSLARYSSTIAVGATTSTDTLHSSSNYGSCVDLFAPGAGITSAFFTAVNATALRSGTSMAAPHVTGVAALYLGQHGVTPVATLTARLLASATPSVLSGLPSGSPNLLLNNGLHNISLRTASGHYLVAEGGGGSFVGSDRTYPSVWERFDVDDLNGASLITGEYINLRTSDGSYIVAENSGGGVVNANRLVAGGWETFKIYNLDPYMTFYTGDRVALQAANGQFVVAESGGGLNTSGAVNANRNAIGAWETFVITVH